MACAGFSVLLVIVSIAETVVEAGPRCFECRDISSPLECGTATECSDNQECFVDQLVSSGGLVLYNTGCRSKQLCSASGKRSLSLSVSNRQSTDLVTCSQCCQGEFCNEEGCGIVAPNPSTRGPNCFQCTNMAYPSECRQVVTCELGQLCMLYEVNKAGTSLYDSRCESERVCKVLASLPQPVGRRRKTGGELCHSCCTGDYCNDRCNVSMATATTAATSATMTVTSASSTEQTTTSQSSTSISTTQPTTMLSSSPTSTSSTAGISISPTQTTHMLSTSTASMLSTAGSMSIADQCRLNEYSYVPFIPLCFKLHTDERSWPSANLACAKDGGTLAVVDVKPKWDFLKVILAQEAAFANKYIWLGARDMNNNNTYYWDTGPEVSFNDWRAGGPDGFQSDDGGECLSSMAADKFQWHDIVCSTLNPFVCTKPV